MSIDNAIRQLRLRNQPVPRPMQLPTEQQINEAEAFVGLPFPPQYRRFLLEASNVVFGTLEPATLVNPESHTFLYGIVEDARSLGVDPDLIPFCEDNGDFFCLTQDGQVRFWSHDYGGVTEESWVDLAHWIETEWMGSRA